MARIDAPAYLRGMKSTLVMLGTVAVVVMWTAIAVLAWTDHRFHLYLIGVGIGGGAVLAYAGWKWKWKRNAQGS
jgi:threonine/homoserine/homoserine lactone efflux protein